MGYIYRYINGFLKGLDYFIQCCIKISVFLYKMYIRNVYSDYLKKISISINHSTFLLDCPNPQPTNSLKLTGYGLAKKLWIKNKLYLVLQWHAFEITQNNIFTYELSNFFSLPKLSLNCSLFLNIIFTYR